jgi:methylphosphotriester-DNA--protein-cysteine methyltransferase
VVNTLAGLIHARGLADFKEVVRGADISQRRLEQIVRAETGVTMRAFWTSARLHLAADLLGRPGYSVKRAQLDAGFRDAPDFTHLFKRHFWKTPSKFRSSLTAAGSGPRSEGLLCVEGGLCPWIRVTAGLPFRWPPAPPDPPISGRDDR